MRYCSIREDADMLYNSSVRNLAGWRGLVMEGWPLTWGFVFRVGVSAGNCRGDT